MLILIRGPINVHWIEWGREQIGALGNYNELVRVIYVCLSGPLGSFA